MRTYSRYADNDSAKMCARGHVLTRLIEVEYLIEYWLNAARRYRTAHRLEHLHRAASAPHLAGRFTRRPACAHRLISWDCGRATPRNGKAKLIPFLGAAHEGGKFGVEAWGGLEERRVADALVDRKLGARNHLRCVFGGDQVRVLVLRPVCNQHRKPTGIALLSRVDVIETCELGSAMCRQIIGHDAATVRPAD